MNISMISFLLRPMTWAGALLSISASAFLAQADSVTDPNIFSHKEVTASSVYSSSGPLGPKGLVDGTGSSAFVFNDGEKTFTLSISGFNSKIDSVRIFDNPTTGKDGVRLANSVTIYYSSKLTQSTKPEDYESKANNGQPYPLDSEEGDYNNSSIRPQGLDLGPNPGNPPILYAIVSDLHIPAGTQSILFSFTSPAHISGDPTAGFYGPGFTQIEGFAIEPKAAAKP